MLDILNLGHDAEWMDHPDRKCLTAHPDAWFPSEAAEKAATMLCRGCPVIAECRTYATARPELEGIWGGTTTYRRHLDRRSKYEMEARQRRKEDGAA